MKPGKDADSTPVIERQDDEGSFACPIRLQEEFRSIVVRRCIDADQELPPDPLYFGSWIRMKDQE